MKYKIYYGPIPDTIEARDIDDAIQKLRQKESPIQEFIEKLSVGRPLTNEIIYDVIIKIYDDEKKKWIQVAVTQEHIRLWKCEKCKNECLIKVNSPTRAPYRCPFSQEDSLEFTPVRDELTMGGFMSKMEVTKNGI